MGPVCEKQPTELEPGILLWNGLCRLCAFGGLYRHLVGGVALSITGCPISDNRVFWCLGLCIGFLFALQPWMMRISRIIYLWFFVRYDPDYEHNPVKRFT